MSGKLRGYTERIYTQNEINDIEVLIGDLGWDYDRMSQSGQETYDKLVNFVESL